MGVLQPEESRACIWATRLRFQINAKTPIEAALLRMELTLLYFPNVLKLPYFK
jgi:hypothetical protein